MSTGIPVATMAGLDNYVERRLRPGHFLQAVLENDLAAAVMRADPENRAALVEVVVYVTHKLPGLCWGSPKLVEDWLARQS